MKSFHPHPRLQFILMQLQLTQLEKQQSRILSKRNFATAVLSLTGLIATVLPAIAFDIISIDGVWTNITSTLPPNNVPCLDTSGNTPDNAAIFYGADNFVFTGGQLAPNCSSPGLQSGFQIDDGPSQTVDFNENFISVQFTHINNPIFSFINPSPGVFQNVNLASADINSTISIDGTPVTLTFRAELEETPNTAGTCAFGDNGDPQQCNDRVTVSVLTPNVEIGGRDNLVVAGFVENPSGNLADCDINGTPSTEFITEEQTSNSACIITRFLPIPETDDVTAPSQVNPEGTNQVQVPDLSGDDALDGTLGAGDTFKIVTLPINGELFYNGSAVTAGQTITNYDPALLTLDPDDGAITVEFTYAAINSIGQEDPTPATVSMPFTEAPPLSISGRVFEDINYGGGAGRNYSDADTSAQGSGFAADQIAVGNVTVELYELQSGNYIKVANTTTAADGTYSFDDSVVTDGNTYRVRVVNDTINSQRPGSNGNELAVQTFRNDPDETTTEITDEVGGANPTSSDSGAQGNGTNLSGITAQSVTEVTINGAGQTDIDFGFNFDTIVNTNDSGQGSLRQFIDNSNLLTNTNLDQDGLTAGVEHTIFMIPAAQLTSGVAVITPTSSLPAITDDSTAIDGTTQTTNIGDNNSGSVGTGGTVGTGPDAIEGTGDEPTLSTIAKPEVEIRGNNSIQIGLDLVGNSETVRGIALYGYGSNGGAGTGPLHGDIIVRGTSALIESNILGSAAATLADPGAGVRTGGAHVYLDQGSATTIQNNFIGYSLRRGIFSTEEAIINFTITNNEIRENNRENDFSGGGIEFTSFAGTFGGSSFDVINPQGTITGNLIADNSPTGEGGKDNGIEFGGTTDANVTVQDNTISGNSSGINAFSLKLPKPHDNDITIVNNVIRDNAGSGVDIGSQRGYLITQNSIYDNGGLGIQLGAGPNDGAFDTNPGTDAFTPTPGNDAIDYPVVTSATLNAGTLEVEGFVGNVQTGDPTFANTTLEFFIADNDPADQDTEVLLGDGLSIPHGEGRTYLGSCSTDVNSLFDCSFTNAGALGLTDPTNITATTTVTRPDGKVITSQFGAVLLTSLDFGDAPVSYDDTDGSGSIDDSDTPAEHVITNILNLGNVAPDDETAPQSSAAADGDDDAAAPAIDDEDGISVFPSLSTDTISYSLDLTVNNDSGSAANVYAWIDFDGDGEFDEDERATVSDGTITLVGGQVPTGSNGTVTLNWSNIGTNNDIADGESFTRVRVTTDDIDTTTETTARDDASVGTASDGEVEDFPLTISEPLFPGIIGTPTTCVATEIPTSELATIPNPSTQFTYSDAGGGGIDVTIQKTDGSDSTGDVSAPLYSIAPTTTPPEIVTGIWLGSDDLDDKDDSPGTTGLDEETYELTFNEDITQTQLTYSAINFNGDGDERIEIVRIEDSNGNDVTASTIFAFTDDTEATFGALQFNGGTGRIEGTVYDPGDGGANASGTFGNSNGMLTVDRTDGFRKVVFKRVEFNNPNSSKSEPDRHRTNGLLLGPIAYCPFAKPPELLLVKRITAVNGVNLTGFDGNDGRTEDENANWPAPLSTYLRGAVSSGTVVPEDEVEFTIYFLSSGEGALTNLAICDLVPDNMTFVADAFQGLSPLDANSLSGTDVGIALASDDTTLPTAPTVYLTNVGEGDRGEFFSLNTEAPGTCNVSDTSVPLPASSNLRGAVFVQVVDGSTTLPNATAPGTPTDSYGFIRFRATVD